MRPINAQLKDLFFIRSGAHAMPWPGARLAFSIVAPCVVVYALFLAGVIPEGSGLPTPANTWFNIVSWIVIGSLLGALAINDQWTVQDQFVRFAAVATCVLGGIFIGSIAGLWLWMTLAVAFIWGLVSAFTGLLRGSDGMVHLAVTVPIVIGFTLPVNEASNLFFAGQGTWSVIWARMGWLVVGLAWAVLVALIVQRLHSRTDPVIDVLRRYSDDVRKAFEAVASERGADSPQADLALEQAYNSGARAAASIRTLSILSGRQRRSHLAVVYSNSERIMRATLALREVQRNLHGEDPRALDELDPIVAACGSALDAAVAGRLDGDALGELTARIDEALTGTSGQVWADEPTAEHFTIALKALGVLVDCLEAVGSRSDVANLNIYPTLEDLGSGPTFLQHMRAEMRRDSDVLHHGIRIGVALVLMVLAYTSFDVPLPFFMALAIVATVQPDVGSSISSALSIGICTVIGSVVAGLVIVAFPNEWAVMAALAIFSFLAFTLQAFAPVILFSMLTPIFILLFTFNDLGAWEYAVDRVLDTAIGAAIGLVCVLLLWPRVTANRWASLYADALRGVGVGVRDVLDEYAASPDSARLDAARPSMLRALRAQRNLQAETQLLTLQPRMLQEVAPMALAAEDGLVDAVTALHVATGGLLLDTQQQVQPQIRAVHARYEEIAASVEVWHAVPTARRDYLDLREELGRQQSVMISPTVDDSLRVLIRSADRAELLVNDAVELAPHGPLTLRNRDLPHTQT